MFWSNVFSYIKYLDLESKNTSKIFLIFKSLQKYGVANFIQNLDDVIQYLSQAVDHFFSMNDWHSLMVVFDLAGITSEVVKDHLTEEHKEFSNCIKNLLLRIKQFFTNTKSRRVINKSIQIFTNLVPYLSKVGFSLEEAKNFSDEDAENTILSDGLAILAHKFYDDLLFILKERDYTTEKSHSRVGISYEAPGFSNTANHTSVIRFFRTLNQHREEFLISGHRYRDIFDCMIERLSAYEDSESNTLNSLVSEYIQLYEELSLPELETEDENSKKLDLVKSLIDKAKSILAQKK